MLSKVKEEFLATDYRGIIVVWKWELDKRIFELIDTLEYNDMLNIQAMSAREGVLTIWWNPIIEKLRKTSIRFKECVDIPDGDVWYIQEQTNKLLKPIQAI